jgi:protocatechuate 3,4-dioxygenase beta subunit
VIRRGKFDGKAWVDAKSSLPLKFVTTGGSDRVSGSETVFDYQPIPDEVFALTIPAGYVKLPPRKGPSISGTVVDKSGKGVAGAEVCAPCEFLHRDRAVSVRTDEKGNFLMELPSHATRLQLPIVVRAFKSDDPYHVAWMFIRNPEDEDAGHDYDEGHHAEALIRDEEALLRDIGGNPGQIVFRQINGHRVPYELTGVVLQMVPATVATGWVTDQAGEPVAGAKVWVDRLQAADGWNNIHIRNTGAPNGEPKAFALTDAEGYFQIGGLPRLPEPEPDPRDPEPENRVQLSAAASGYVEGHLIEAKTMGVEQKFEFDIKLLAAELAIRGTVIDNYGQPLVGRSISVEFRNLQDDDEDDNDNYDDEPDDRIGIELEMEGTVIDAQGKFELAGVPRLPGSGLMLTVDASYKPDDWDWDKHTKNVEFVYYVDTSVSIKLEPGKKDYSVEIVPQRPDISVDVEVKNSAGGRLHGLPVGVLFDDDFTAEGDIYRWCARKLMTKTDENGSCTIACIPAAQNLRLWIGQPGNATFENEIRAVREKSYTQAITESATHYTPTQLPIELEPTKKE